MIIGNQYIGFGYVWTNSEGEGLGSIDQSGPLVGQWSMVKMLKAVGIIDVGINLSRIELTAPKRIEANG